MSAVILSHCHTPHMMDISPGNETLQSLIRLCNSAKKSNHLSLSLPLFRLSVLAQSHSGLSKPPQPWGSRRASSCPAPTASQNSAGEKPGLRNRTKANRAGGRRRRMSLRKTNRNREKQRRRTSAGSKANNQLESEVTTSLAAAAASSLTTHPVIPPAIFCFSYLGKLAGAALSPAHILLFNIITSNQ